MPDHEERVTALALAVGRNDRRALDEWVHATHADVWRFLAHLAGAEHAEDLTQETYMRAIPSLSRFSARSSSRAWLISIARKVNADHLRATYARRRKRNAAQQWALIDNQGQTGEGAAPDVVEAIMLLDDLTTTLRESLVLTQIIGLSYAEAARACSCAVGTIRSRVARARETLIAQSEVRAD